MTLLDRYRGTVQRKKQEISTLQASKAKEQKKHADLSVKEQRTSEAIRRTKSASTVRTKVGEMERHKKDLAKLERKIADLEAKIARKQKELNDEERKMAREEEKESKRRMKQIDGTLARHGRLHSETQSTLLRLQELPETIVVLFLAASPSDKPQLRLDEEARGIAEMIRKAEHRDSVKLESCWAVRPVDILQALNEFQPAVIHFSGHGSERNELAFLDNSGNTKLVSKDAIVQTMMASSESIRLVFFNTCYSKNQAEAVVEHVDAAIGLVGMGVIGRPQLDDRQLAGLLPVGDAIGLGERANGADAATGAGGEQELLAGLRSGPAPHVPRRSGP